MPINADTTLMVVSTSTITSFLQAYEERSHQNCCALVLRWTLPQVGGEGFLARRDDLGRGHDYFV